MCSHEKNFTKETKQERRRRNERAIFRHQSFRGVSGDNHCLVHTYFIFLASHRIILETFVSDIYTQGKKTLASFFRGFL